MAHKMMMKVIAILGWKKRSMDGTGGHLGIFSKRIDIIYQK
jgi:hypothetical protein